MVVLLNLSLSSPLWYENLAASIKALWTVLNGRVNELPWFSIESVESSEFGST